MNNNLEIERKWLIDKKSLPKGYKNYKNKIITQFYISKKPSIRFRKINNDYFLTIKIDKKNNNLVRYEYDIKIDKKCYLFFINKCSSIVLRKKRYYIPYKKHLIEVDIFDKPYNNLVYAEVEFKNVASSKKFIPPIWFGKELTNDKKATNTYLAFKYNKM